MKRYIKSAIMPLFDEPLDALLSLAEDPQTDSESLEDIYNAITQKTDYEPNDMADIQYALMANPNTPKDISLSIFHKALKDQRLFTHMVCQTNNRNLLLMFGNYNASEAIAESESTPSFLLEILANDNNEYVVMAVLENPNTPLYVLENALTKAISSDDAFMMTEIAYNPNTTTEMLEQIYSATDAAPTMAALVSNPNTPIQIIQELCDYQYDSEVREFAQTQLNNRQ